MGSGTRNFIEIFGSTLQVFFFFWLFTPASLTESCSFMYGSKELFPLHKLDDR